ncbi:CAP domain-containing protein [Peribacillus frigoritolerans]|nr:CAP domain-containing protein [Peribacillus frigoritolerans]
MTNASRVNHDLSVLSWDKRVKVTAQDHSADMAVNQYFNHTNLEGNPLLTGWKMTKSIFEWRGKTWLPVRIAVSLLMKA